jgi:hypothetical protein
VLAAVGILAVWFTGIAALTAIAEPTRSVVVVGPLSTTLRAATAADTALVAVHRGFTEVRSERKGFVRDLYRGGAWFVWPTIDGGCLFSVPQRRT